MEVTYLSNMPIYYSMSKRKKKRILELDVTYLTEIYLNSLY